MGNPSGHSLWMKHCAGGQSFSSQITQRIYETHKDSIRCVISAEVLVERLGVWLLSLQMIACRSGSQRVASARPRGQVARGRRTSAVTPLLHASYVSVTYSVFVPLPTESSATEDTVRRGPFLVDLSACVHRPWTRSKKQKLREEQTSTNRRISS